MAQSILYASGIQTREFSPAEGKRVPVLKSLSPSGRSRVSLSSGGNFRLLRVIYGRMEPDGKGSFHTAPESSCRPLERKLA